MYSDFGEFLTRRHITTHLDLQAETDRAADLGRSEEGLARLRLQTLGRWLMVGPEGQQAQNGTPPSTPTRRATAVEALSEPAPGTYAVWPPWPRSPAPCAFDAAATP